MVPAKDLERFGIRPGTDADLQLRCARCKERMNAKTLDREPVVTGCGHRYCFECVRYMVYRSVGDQCRCVVPKCHQNVRNFCSDEILARWWPSLLRERMQQRSIQYGAGTSTQRPQAQQHGALAIRSQPNATSGQAEMGSAYPGSDGNITIDAVAIYEAIVCEARREVRRRGFSELYMEAFEAVAYKFKQVLWEHDGRSIPSQKFFDGLKRAMNVALFQQHFINEPRGVPYKFYYFVQDCVVAGADVGRQVYRSQSVSKLLPEARVTIDSKRMVQDMTDVVKRNLKSMRFNDDQSQTYERAAKAVYTRYKDKLRAREGRDIYQEDLVDWLWQLRNEALILEGWEGRIDVPLKRFLWRMALAAIRGGIYGRAQYEDIIQRSAAGPISTQASRAPAPGSKIPVPSPREASAQCREASAQSGRARVNAGKASVQSGTVPAQSGKAHAQSGKGPSKSSLKAGNPPSSHVPAGTSSAGRSSTGHPPVITSAGKQAGKGTAENTLPGFAPAICESVSDYSEVTPSTTTEIKVTVDQERVTHAMYNSVPGLAEQYGDIGNTAESYKLAAYAVIEWIQPLLNDINGEQMFQEVFLALLRDTSMEVLRDADGQARFSFIEDPDFKQLLRELVVSGAHPNSWKEV